MSIARPNFDKLPSKQKEKREAERRAAALAAVAEEPRQSEALLTADGADALRRGRGARLPRPPATCHPRRVEVSGGLCRICVAARVNRNDRINMTPEQALTAVTVKGEDTLAKEVRAYLQQNVMEYSQLHIEAARIAALRGDPKPSEWALTHIRVGEAPIVSPPNKDAGGGGGIKVLIGLNIGGLPAGAVTAQTLDPVAIEGETLPAGNDT